MKPETFVRNRFGPQAVLEPLAGDASDRCYFRIRPADGSTAVLMALSRPVDPPYEPFHRMAGFLASAGFPVPHVREIHEAAGMLLLDDLGDVSLQSHLQGPAGTDPGEWTTLYEEAVDWIVRLQQVGTRSLTPSVPAYHFALDAVRLGRELDYFVEHFARGLLGDPLRSDGATAETLRSQLVELAGRAGRPGDQVLCHRDYHSRNLMMPKGRTDGGRLVIIDFQDARLGSRAYDLASLLCDAYLEIPADLVVALRHRFVRGAGLSDRVTEFDRDFAAVAAQRCLKAVGTFAGQAVRFGVTHYLEYIPRALQGAREALETFPEHAALRELLQDRLEYRGETPAGK